MKTRTWWLALLVFALSLPSFTALAKPPEVTRFGVGDSKYWKGPYIERETVFWEACGVQGPCYDYKIRIDEVGARLRVALHWPDFSDGWALAVYDPDGNLLPLVWDPASMPLDEQAAASLWEGARSREVYVKAPQVGVWRLRVIPFDVSQSAFLLRAKLEGPADTPLIPVVLAPNLRAEPPADLTFAAPKSMGAPRATPLHFEEFEVGDEKPLSCTPREIEGGARRCLRLTAGVENVGDGPLDIRYGPATTGDAAAYQRVYSSDGTYEQKEAGTYFFHGPHLHFHYNNLAEFSLHRVIDERLGIVGSPGVSSKSGWCLGHSAIIDIETFEQDAPRGGDCESATDAWIGLSRGWVDLYGWMLNGNYVEFGNNPDGLYVVRVTVDPGHQLTETNELDNDSYALVRVTGDDVVTLERGYGKDPWDPSASKVD